VASAGESPQGVRGVKIFTFRGDPPLPPPMDMYVDYPLHSLKDEKLSVVVHNIKKHKFWKNIAVYLINC